MVQSTYLGTRNIPFKFAQAIIEEILEYNLMSKSKLKETLTRFIVEEDKY